MITTVNKAVEEMLGYSKGELIGKHARELEPQGCEYEEAGMKLIKKMHEEGAVTGREGIFKRIDGTLLDIEQSATFLRDKDGNLIGSMSSFRDITERKQTEKELQEAKEHLG